MHEELRRPIRVLIGSAGRRVYLVRWFQAAFARLGVLGEVHVTDADHISAAGAAAVARHAVPRYDDPGYGSEMLALFDALRPDLFFSLNDHELVRLASDGLAAKLAEFGGIVLALDAGRQAAVDDKLRMSRELARAGLPSPPTVLLSDSRGVRDLVGRHRKVIIKDRYGSGSSGLVRCDRDDLAAAAAWSIHAATAGARARAHRPEDELVLQPDLGGVEFGIDIVAPLRGSHRLGVMARQKLSMRTGETDQAVTVDGSPFESLARDIAQWTEHRGLIDVDVIRQDDGSFAVIDINPRFGGGYPFTHAAGADVPALYVAQLAAEHPRELESFLEYETGFVSSKYIDVMPTGTADRER